MPRPSDPHVRRLASAVLMPGFRSVGGSSGSGGSNGNSGGTAPDWLRREVEAGLGGVCLFAPNVGVVDDRGDVSSLTWDLHELRPDLVVASDEEGGEVTRLDARTGSPWPTAAALGVVDDLAATTAVATGAGRRCREQGIDLALAPVVDLRSSAESAVVGLRSFGREPRLVARHAAAFVAGLQSAGVAACAKHFPGHGDTLVDSHLELPVVPVDLETLRARELVPFGAVVEAGVRAVMTAHIVFPALDPHPATLSPHVLELLRGELGFSGLVVSDAVDMQAISATIGRGPGAAAALAAGVDLVCIGNPHHPTPYDDEAVYHEVLDAVVAAVVAGDLRVDRLEEAVRRIAELAWWVGENRAAATAADEARGSELEAADRAASLEIARRALVVHDVRPFTRVVHVVDLREAPGLATGARPPGVVEALSSEAADVTVHAVSTAAEPLHALSLALAEADDADVVVVVGALRLHPAAQRRLDHVLASRPDAVVVATGAVDERDRLGEHWVATSGDTPTAGRAVADLLLP